VQEVGPGPAEHRSRLPSEAARVATDGITDRDVERAIDRRLALRTGSERRENEEREKGEEAHTAMLLLPGSGDS
jgi:hypothetical protein